VFKTNIIVFLIIMLSTSVFSANATDLDITNVVAYSDMYVGCSPLTVNLDCQVSGGDAPISYEWDLGDGTTVSQRYAMHSYSGHGTSYDIICTAVDADGDTMSDTKTISLATAAGCGAADPWCCTNGLVEIIPYSTCLAQGGKDYYTAQSAQLACENTSGEKWCCANGQIEMTDKSSCDAKGGSYHDTIEDAETICLPSESDEKWCCANGQIEMTDEAGCDAKGGSYHETIEDAEMECTPMDSEKWCCANGQIEMIDEAGCTAKGGSYHESIEDAEMECFPPEMDSEKWCCADGQIEMTDEAGCAGQIFETIEEAEMHCFPTATEGEKFCCIDGIVEMTDEAGCDGSYHETFDEAQGVCYQDGEKYCCVNGNIEMTTMDLCDGNGGTYHESIDEAAQACGGDPDVDDHGPGVDDNVGPDPDVNHDDLGPEPLAGMDDDEVNTNKDQEKVVDNINSEEGGCCICPFLCGICPYLWIILGVFSGLTSYIAWRKLEKNKSRIGLSVGVFILPLIIGWLISPCWGILLAILELLFFIFKH